MILLVGTLNNAIKTPCIVRGYCGVKYDHTTYTQAIYAQTLGGTIMCIHFHLGWSEQFPFFLSLSLQSTIDKGHSFYYQRDTSTQRGYNFTFPFLYHLQVNFSRNPYVLDHLFQHFVLYTRPTIQLMSTATEWYKRFA